MFEYVQGYEIDGSDTSYSILMPEKEKCFEILKYYFSLKIIHRGKAFEIINVSGKDKKKFPIKEYKFEELDDFFNGVSNADIDIFEIVFSYVSPRGLYPEVKREIIDTLFEIEGVNQPKLIEPTFYELFTSGEIVTVFLNPYKAKKCQEQEVSLSRDAYVNAIVKNDFFLLDFNCSLGAPYYYAIYAASKLSKRFPELEIETKESARYIAYDGRGAHKYVCECVEIESFDFEVTIERIISNPCVSKVHTYQSPNNDEIFLAHIPKTLEGYGKHELRYENSDKDDGTFSIKSDTPYFDILQGIYKKNSISVSDYVKGVLQLANVSYFSDSDFEAYTAFYIWVCCGKDDKCYCEVKFIKRLGTIKLCLIMPYDKREKVKKALKI